MLNASQASWRILNYFFNNVWVCHHFFNWVARFKILVDRTWRDVITRYSIYPCLRSQNPSVCLLILLLSFLSLSNKFELIFYEWIKFIFAVFVTQNLLYKVLRIYLIILGTDKLPWEICYKVFYDRLNILANNILQLLLLILINVNILLLLVYLISILLGLVHFLYGNVLRYQLLFLQISFLYWLSLFILLINLLIKLCTKIHRLKNIIITCCWIFLLNSFFLLCWFIYFLHCAFWTFIFFLVFSSFFFILEQFTSF